MILWFLRLFPQYRKVEADLRAFREAEYLRLTTVPFKLGLNGDPASNMLAEILNRPNPVMASDWNPITDSPVPSVDKWGYFPGKNGVEFRPQV